MSMKNIYATFDSASGLYSHPLFALSDGEIMREFSDLVQDASHPIGKHPEDYSLMRMGTYDDLTGTFNNENNECLATGLETLSLTRKIDPAAHQKLNSEIAIHDQKPGGTA